VDEMLIVEPETVALIGESGPFICIARAAARFAVEG
jgi:hypothetical protein